VSPEPEPAGAGPVTATVTRHVRPGTGRPRRPWPASGARPGPSPATSAKRYSAPTAARAAGTGSSAASTRPPTCAAGWTPASARRGWRAEPHAAGPMRTQVLTGLEGWYTLPRSPARPAVPYEMAIRHLGDDLPPHHGGRRRVGAFALDAAAGSPARGDDAGDRVAGDLGRHTARDGAARMAVPGPAMTRPVPDQGGAACSVITRSTRCCSRPTSAPPVRSTPARPALRCCSTTSSSSPSDAARQPAGRHQEHHRHRRPGDQGLLARRRHRRRSRPATSARRPDPGPARAGTVDGIADIGFALAAWFTDPHHNSICLLQLK
jgi:hypothetical protein